jgi:hypothetical protein
MYDSHAHFAIDTVAEISVSLSGADPFADFPHPVMRRRAAALTPGERNRNPGNIRRNGTAWQGLVPDHASDDDLCVFTDDLYGVRALARMLLSYQRTHGLKTLRQIVRHWAETKHVDATSYASLCASRVGCAPDAEIDLEHYAVLSALVRAIIHCENGRVACRNVVPEAVRLALA